MTTDYAALTSEECLDRLRLLKEREGERLVILGHHYQRQDVLQVADFIGDSFELSRRAAEQQSATTIAFCGVHFMAESAYLLSPPGRQVLLPDPTAGCPMADMAEVEQVEAAWKHLEERFGPKPAIPVVYMNSTAAIKAFCGAHGGLVCTSGNARNILDWAFERRQRVLFLPDEHLGRNTAHAMGMSDEDVALWRPYAERGGVGEEALDRARMILWKGFCVVHQRLTEEDVARVRREHPRAKIYVHPECKAEVVALSDGSGSTKYLVEVATKAAPGDEVFIGTEVHLVDRLAATMPEKHIEPLARTTCSNMAKITVQKLLETLEVPSPERVVVVDEHLRADARLALQRMLDVCA